MRALLLVLPLVLAFACGEDTPVPDYPFPVQPPVAERADLAPYVSGGEDDYEEPVEEEEWDDGLSDEDLEMPEQGASGGEASE